MALLATAPIVRRFWPLSQVVRALETYKPQGYKSWLQQNSDGRYIFCFQTDRQAHDEHGFRVGTEVYEARFECVPRRVHENNPPRAGKIDPEELEMIEPHVLEEALKMIPARRMGQPDEVAAAVAFLMSPDAAYITRQVISVNGGMVG